MSDIKEKQTLEAVYRMGRLGLLEPVIRDFLKGKLNRSENSGLLFWLNNTEIEDVRKWEKETGNLVYHVIKTNTEFGTCYSYLYVSKHEGDWKYDREDLNYLTPLVYVLVKDGSGYSEFGRIGIRNSLGGLVRTC